MTLLLLSKLKEKPKQKKLSAFDLSFKKVLKVVKK